MEDRNQDAHPASAAGPEPAPRAEPDIDVTPAAGAPDSIDVPGIEPSATLAPAVPVPRGPGDPDLPWDPSARARHPGLMEWFIILTVAGTALVALRELEASVLVGLAGIFISAQGADLDMAWRRVYHLTSWLTPVCGMLVFAAMAQQFWMSPSLSSGTRWFVAGWSGMAAVLCILTGLRPVSNFLIHLLFRATAPNHALRLAARLVMMGLLSSVPLWFFVQQFQVLLPDELRRMAAPGQLGGSLIGYVVLALASVGFLVRRSLAATLARLGITMLRPRDLLVIPIAVGGMWLFNGATEWLEQRLAPELWRQDQSFTALLASDMTLLQAALLGLSAGIGEEITMRGALQPRLGIPLTALLFAGLHAQYSWFGLMVIFLIGVLLGLLRRHTSTTVAMATHAIYDAVALIGAMKANPTV